MAERPRRAKTCSTGDGCSCAGGNGRWPRSRSASCKQPRRGATSAIDVDWLEQLGREACGGVIGLVGIWELQAHGQVVGESPEEVHGRRECPSYVTRVVMSKRASQRLERGRLSPLLEKPAVEPMIRTSSGEIGAPLNDV